MMSVEITIIITVLGLVISFQAYQLNKEKRQSDKENGAKQEASQDAEVRAQLNYISRGVDDIRIDLKANEKQIAQHSERIRGLIIWTRKGVLSMVEILAIATVIAPITNGAVQAVKKATGINKKYLPLLAVAVGIGLGAAAFFVDIGIGERLWAGGISGLASVGLFELSKNTKGDN